jgi:hypothetical protein
MQPSAISKQASALLLAAAAAVMVRLHVAQQGLRKHNVANKFIINRRCCGFLRLISSTQELHIAAVLGQHDVQRLLCRIGCCSSSCSDLLTCAVLLPCLLAISCTSECCISRGASTAAAAASLPLPAGAGAAVCLPLLSSLSLSGLPSGLYAVTCSPWLPAQLMRALLGQ